MQATAPTPGVVTWAHGEVDAEGVLPTPSTEYVCIWMSQPSGNLHPSGAAQARRARLFIMKLARRVEFERYFASLDALPEPRRPRGLGDPEGGGGITHHG